MIMQHVFVWGLWMPPSGLRPLLESENGAKNRSSLVCSAKMEQCLVGSPDGPQILHDSDKASAGQANTAFCALTPEISPSRSTPGLPSDRLCMHCRKAFRE